MKQAKTNTMKAVAIDRFGGPETLTLETLPVPEVGPDEVLIRVESADVAVWDPFEREGGFAKLYGIKPRFPHVMGSDGAGTVAAVGKHMSLARFRWTRRPRHTKRSKNTTSVSLPCG
jgi:NADPH:quinone reductase-like Zn-dependent oxidoreductase